MGHWYHTSPPSVSRAALGREMDALLQRLAGEQPSRIGRLVFLVNNAAAVVSIAQARGLAAEDGAAAFTGALAKEVEAYVDAEMDSAGFRPLIAFVRKVRGGVV